MATKTRTTAKKDTTAKPKVSSDVMSAPLYNMKGEQSGEVRVPENVFGLPWNADLVHQVVVSMQANARHGKAHTKDRGEVQGGGKKPWRQKGTGRSRHGSSRSPIWVGGGVAHGPRTDKDYSKKINRKMREKALLVTLSRKFKDGEIIFVDKLEMNEPKAATAKAVLASLGKAGFAALSGKKKNAALIALPSAHRATMKSFGNFGTVETTDVRDINPVAVLSHKYLIVADPAAAIEFFLSKRVVKK